MVLQPRQGQTGNGGGNGVCCDHGRRRAGRVEGYMFGAHQFTVIVVIHACRAVTRVSQVYSSPFTGKVFIRHPTLAASNG